MRISSTGTCSDVARLAGVSQPTVSRVINNHPGISPATALKVRDAAKQIGYAPGRASIRKGHRPKSSRPSFYRKMQVALVSQFRPSLLETPVYSKVLRGIEDELGKLNYNFIIRNLPDENPEDAIPHKIDGAILFHVPAMQSQMQLLRELRNMPCVRIMEEISDNEFFDHVTYNNTAVGRLAAEHLLSKGHRKLLYMGRENEVGYPFYGRHRSFMSTLRKAGAKAFEILSDDFIDESGNVQLPNVKTIADAIEKMKLLPEFPTAIFATADTIVVGLYHTLKHYDIIPGKDVEIIGVNNDSVFLNQLSPRPASVDINPERIGRKAVERLLWRIDNPKEPLEKLLLEPEMAFS
ncbi:MAG: LacI family DNA-binding transcriptional regulator [Victivallales bacterium]|jgi:LacI family transcriptional regulator